ncbi:MAG: hypothetical protein ACK5UX_01530 [Burkholderiales bacterium]|jgi:hypothetical protein
MPDTIDFSKLVNLDDTLRFRLQAQQIVHQEDARISVEVHALVSTAQPEGEPLEQRIRAALNTFIRSDWSFSSIRRVGDAVGFERVALYAATRTPIAEIHNLEERARTASREGLSLKEPKVNYGVPVQRVNDAVTQLRAQIIEDAKREIIALNKLTGRTWRIGDIVFGMGDVRSEHRTGKGAYRSEDDEMADLLGGDTADPRMTSAERISLVADVTLRSRV